MGDKELKNQSLAEQESILQEIQVRHKNLYLHNQEKAIIFPQLCKTQIKWY